ncbi:transposable element Tc3 transposase [Trichonephila clavipes]|uniref:Transposable element Tc3 transposase n=1 Tax=Trichonephila clavipes TaxID=2585209 RepID=A0A8X6SV90_TRICX|nr:transposable element Tc3 transposase [Trichonephila clavipes]
MRSHIYRDVILEQHVSLFRGAMGAEFVFMDDNARPHRANIVDECFQFDEVHFWLNGYVNKQNCRIWSEANPQVYVETPLHPEKLTVWCALWAGGILLQKR